MKKFRVINSHTIGFFTIAVIILLYFTPIDFINQLELKTLDLRFQFSQKEIPSQDIAIVAIDNKSEDSIGNWPWPRDTHAKVIDNLNKWGAKVIGFDVIFPKEGKNPISQVLAETDLEARVPADVINEYRQKLNKDGILASSIEKAGNVVLGYYFFTEGDEQVKHLTQEEKISTKKVISKSEIPLVSQRGSSTESDRFLVRRGYGAEISIEQISRSSEDLGFLNVFPDSDGIVRRTTLPMKYNFEKQWYGSFPLHILQNYLDENAQLVYSQTGVSLLSVGGREIPVDASGALLIDYSVDFTSFPVYSFVDVMNGDIKNPDDFKNKIVLIGITDPGLVRDVWPTPTNKVTPGIKIHAQAINTILNQRFISYARAIAGDSFVYSSDTIHNINLLAIILLGLILALAIPKFSRASHGAYAAIFLLAGYILLGFFLFKNMRMRVNMVYPVASVALVYTVETLYRALTTEKSAREIRSAFRTYVPPQVVDELIKNPEKMQLGGERKVVSVLYSDVKSFTSISEKLSPEDLVELMNSYLTPMSEIVFKYEGTLDKYIGDAVVAFYGAPLPQEDHPLRVVLSALDMLKTLKELWKRWEKENKPLIDIGIGINTGEVSVGNMGSNMRFDYTVMGDNVNLAQRIEELTRIYKNNILISEFTYQQIKDDIICREIDEIVVRGRTKKIKIYEPIGRKGEINTESKGLIKGFEAGLEFYREKKFEDAKIKFEQVLEIAPEDGPSKYFLVQIKNKANA